MKRARISLLAVAIALAAPGTVAWAALTAAIVNPADNSTSIQALAGSILTVKVRLTGPSNNLVSGQFKVQETSGSGFFTLNSATFAGTASPPTGWYAEFDPTPVALVAGNAYTSGEFGATAYDLDNGVATPNDMLTIDVAIGGSATPGSYALQLTDMVFGNVNFDEELATAGSPFVIEVVPAPGAVVLGMIGLGMAGWVKRRFRAIPVESCSSARL